jgi:hypothetical protein
MAFRVEEHFFVESVANGFQDTAVDLSQGELGIDRRGFVDS